VSRPNTTEVYTRVLVRAPKDEDYLVSLSHASRILPTSNPWRVQYGRRMVTRWMFALPSSKASRNAGGSEMSFIKPRRNGTSPVRKRSATITIADGELRLRLALRRHRRFKSCPIDLTRQAHPCRLAPRHARQPFQVGDRTRAARWSEESGHSTPPSG
jgi:hypothetical protein